MLKRAWESWKVFSITLGDFQSRIILTLFYFTFAAPFGLALRLFGDPLHLRGYRIESAWPERPAAVGTIEEARRQF